MKSTDYAEHLRVFLTHYLPIQRNASKNTITSYRDTFVQLIRYCQKTHNIPAEKLSLNELEAERILEFLDYIESENGVCSRTRNHRLAVLHSFFRYVQLQSPEHLAQCQRILAIPFKRTHYDEPVYLSPKQIAALLGQPDRSTRQGVRNSVLLSVLYDTGARVQELVTLRMCDINLTEPASVRLTGKGRKSRLVPLMNSTVKLLKLNIQSEGLVDEKSSERTLFLSQRGAMLTRWGVRYLVQQCCRKAKAKSVVLPNNITAHSFRHAKAMHLVQAGNPLVIIKDILGHASIESTEIYARADLEMKRRALESVATEIKTEKKPRWLDQPQLLDWLMSL